MTRYHHLSFPLSATPIWSSSGLWPSLLQSTLSPARRYSNPHPLHHCIATYRRMRGSRYMRSPVLVSGIPKITWETEARRNRLSASAPRLLQETITTSTKSQELKR
ncbi:hypothetical protein FA15DRAFT_68112 [Coprinopsis marcescibilis]|uniref:Uncharacterized protein n=1 Tax=Coprinopsis marcescibilis TaxID=230819 RepID=A0A5C3KN44_COPMA|nr:hypothetical protein FA15DRAFT_68112 [Coprinopsis marcescibilis]